MRAYIVLLTGLFLCASCGSDSLNGGVWPINDRLEGEDNPSPRPVPLPDPATSPNFSQISAWIGGEHIGNCIEDVSFMRFGEGGKLEASFVEHNHCLDESQRGLYSCLGSYKFSGEDFAMECSSREGKGFGMSASGTAWSGELNDQQYLGLGVFWGEPLTGADSGRWRASFSRELRGLPSRGGESPGTLVESFELELNGLEAPMLMGGDFPELRLKGQFEIGDSLTRQGGSFDMPLRVYAGFAPTGGMVVSFVEPNAQYPNEQWQQILERHSGLGREEAQILARLIPIRYMAVSLQINGEFQWVLAPIDDTSYTYPRVWRGSTDLCGELSYTVENGPGLVELCAR